MLRTPPVTRQSACKTKWHSYWLRLKSHTIVSFLSSSAVHARTIIRQLNQSQPGFAKRSVWTSGTKCHNEHEILESQSNGSNVLSMNSQLAYQHRTRMWLVLDDVSLSSCLQCFDTACWVICSYIGPVKIQWRRAHWARSGLGPTFNPAGRARSGQVRPGSVVFTTAA